DEARATVHRSGGRAAAALRRAADRARDAPGWFGRATETLQGFGGDVQAATGTWALQGAAVVAEQNTLRQLVNPLGALHDRNQLVGATAGALSEGARSWWQHPTATARAAWDGVQDDPGLTVAGAVPDAVLGALTGGAGAVATRAAGLTASLGARTALRLEQVARAAG
ncbi:hypothetical protein, partial [Angustibacter aerolatus]